ncbi:MAG: hypothetical protein IJS87_02475 [Rhodocyclaceae bacterium]|nr:hypothetical protein [Rhodocyclaceae bacterium]
MNLGKFNQQPDEVLDYDILYKDWLDKGDEIQAARVSVEPQGMMVHAVFVHPDRVKLWLAGGDDGASYKLTVTVDTKDGRVKQDEFKMKVKDV